MVADVARIGLERLGAGPDYPVYEETGWIEDWWKADDRRREAEALSERAAAYYEQRSSAWRSFGGGPTLSSDGMARTLALVESVDVRPRVLVVDDHEVVREGLIATLTPHGYDIVGAASTAAEAVAVARSTLPDIALVDIRLPDLSGEEVCPILREAVPQMSLIILTTYLSEEMVRRALAAGAAEYVTKAAGLPALLAALDRVRANAARPYASEIVRQLYNVTAKRLQAVPLTPQQESVLELAAQGLTNDEIGRRLFITESTVRFHLGKLRETFGARSKTELVAKAIRSGALSPALDAYRE